MTFIGLTELQEQSRNAAHMGAITHRVETNSRRWIAAGEALRPEMGDNRWILSGNVSRLDMGG